MINPVSNKEILEYEVSASWWAEHISWQWAQELASRYFAWKVNLKYGRYLRRLAIAERIEARHAQKQATFTL